MEELSWFFGVDDLGDDLAEIVAASEPYNRVNINKAQLPDPAHELQVFFAEVLEDVQDWHAEYLPLVAGYVQPLPRFFDEWQWDDVTPPDPVVLGYQQADNFPAPPPDDAWNWDDTVDEELYLDAFLQDVYAAPVTDSEWDWDEAVYAEPIPTGYQNANGIAPPSPVQQMDAEWDWDEVLAPELVPMGYQQADAAQVAAPAQTFGQEWDFDESVEDEWLADFASGPVGANGVLILAQVFDDAWLDDDLDDEWLVDESQRAPAPASQQPVEDAWDWDEVTDDDWAIDDAQQTLVAAQADDAWDHFGDLGEDEWTAESHPVGISFLQPRPTLDDAWDWGEDVDDEWPTDEGQKRLVYCIDPRFIARRDPLDFIAYATERNYTAYL